MTQPLVLVDLDGTLLHDAPVFEQRAASDFTIAAMKKLHDYHIPYAVATARPVSTGLQIVQDLQADACIYLNGALIDYDPQHSNFDILTGKNTQTNHPMQKIGFSSQRACDVCLSILDVLPNIEIGIVMDDVRYTNFDVKKYWTTQAFTYTDFQDVPQGIADKIIIFPDKGEWKILESLIPDDFTVHISEGRMWMLMAPLANKAHCAQLLSDYFHVSAQDVIAFGDDIIDIEMMRYAGTGVAVANAHPDVLTIADDICASNNEDGVARWIQSHLLDL